MNFPLSVGPSTEMGDHTRQREKSPTSAGIEPTTSEFDRPSLYRLSYEASREQVVDDNGGNCGNANVQVIRVQTYCKPWVKWGRGLGY